MGVWLLGVVCLWIPWYVRRWGERWYRATSLMMRPLGGALIVAGWAVTLAVPVGWETLSTLTVLPTQSAWMTFSGFGVGVFLTLGLWVLSTAGPRRALLLQLPDEPLLTKGPYSIVRHPGMLSLAGMTFFALQIYLAIAWIAGLRGEFTAWHSWFFFAIALAMVAVTKDGCLADRFGKSYEEYVRRTPFL